MRDEILYYPCIVDHNGRILKSVSRNPMTREEAEELLKQHYSYKWLRCEAIPQPSTLRGLHF